VTVPSKRCSPGGGGEGGSEKKGFEGGEKKGGCSKKPIVTHIARNSRKKKWRGKCEKRQETGEIMKLRKKFIGELTLGQKRVSGRVVTVRQDHERGKSIVLIIEMGEGTLKRCFGEPDRVQSLSDSLRPSKNSKGRGDLPRAKDRKGGSGGGGYSKKGGHEPIFAGEHNLLQWGRRRTRCHKGGEHQRNNHPPPNGGEIMKGKRGVVGDRGKVGGAEGAVYYSRYMHAQHGGGGG